MTSHRTPFVGVYPAIPTPFDEDGDVDYETVRRHVRFLEEAGVDGIVPAGSTGESATLSHDEHIEVIEFVVDVAEEAAVIGGTGSNSTREALSLSRRAVDAGVDGLLLVSPYYNLPEPKGMEDHYRTIADEIDAPQIIYNVPGRTGRNITVDTAASLATHENIVGYKAASADLQRISEVIERTRTENFSVLSGDDPVTLPILGIGGTGVISVAGNVIPEQVCELVDAALDGDYEHARDRHHELGPLFRAMFAETNPIPVKEALKMRGYGNAHFRPPLTPAEDEIRDDLRVLLDGVL
jgi:4-hydroxy-tetrahydrodipicolinate synthase